MYEVKIARKLRATDICGSFAASKIIQTIEIRDNNEKMNDSIGKSLKRFLHWGPFIAIGEYKLNLV